MEDRFLLQTFDFEGVSLLDGMLKKQVEATRDFYFDLPDDSILFGFRRRAGLDSPGAEFSGWYGGEREVPDQFKEWWQRGDTFSTFGQWLSGMARLSKATADGDLREKARHLMREWAKTIEPDGYFFYSRKPITPHYCYEKIVQGLVDLYAYANDEEALSLLERITDWAEANLDRTRRVPTPTIWDWASQGVEWYTLPENLYRAHLLTGNPRYRDFADVWRYSSYWAKFRQSSAPDIHGVHAYSHCNSLSSAAMAYAVHGEREYLETTVNAYDYFERTQCYATGGYGPAEKLQPSDGSLGKSLEVERNTFEVPCGTWAGFKLSRYLTQFTGDSRYGDWVEKLLYNCIGAALPFGPRGLTYYYADYRLGGGRKVYHWARFPCCSGTYIQDIAEYHNLIYYKDNDGIYVSQFVPSRVTWNHEGAQITIEQETAYPESETTSVTVHPSRNAEFTLAFRVPRWCEGATIECEGKLQPIECRPGTWARLRRVWKSGDRVLIRLPMHPVLRAVDRQHPNRVALMQGPLVLVQDQSPRIRMTSAQLLGSLSEPEHMIFHSSRPDFARFVPFYRMGYQDPYVMYFDLEN
jgi:DUF1680 family protein